MRGEYDSKVINAQEAQCLVNQLQLYYSQNDEKKLTLLKRFTREPESFKHMDVIDELNNLTIKWINHWIVLKIKRILIIKKVWFLVSVFPFYRKCPGTCFTIFDRLLTVTYSLGPSNQTTLLSQEVITIRRRKWRPSIQLIMDPKCQPKWQWQLRIGRRRSKNKSGWKFSFVDRKQVEKKNKNK